MMKRLVALCVMVVCLAGCTVKFGYNNLDRLIRWQVADYVELDERQMAYFNAELAQVLHWHRTTQLPLYAGQLERMARDFDETIALGDVQSVFDQVVDWANALEARAVPLMVETLLSLSDEQVAGLPEAFERSNAEFMEDEVDLTPEEAREQWRDRVQGSMQFFAGRLNRDQRDYIATQSLRYQPEFVLWADFRARWQVALLDALEQREDISAFETAFQSLIDDRESFWGEEFAKATKANEALGKEVMHGLLASLDDRQTERFQDKLLSLAEDFRELSADAEPPKPATVACLVRC